MKQILHIAIALDENYITPCYVLLTSIFLNNKEEDIHIHAIATGVTDEQKCKMQQFARKNNAQLCFYNITEDMVAGLVKPGNSWLTVAAYYRIFFPVLVPNDVKKLVYIDTDAIVIKNLKELYNTDTEGKPVAAVQEVLGEVRPEIHFYDRFNYFNSGVMVINVEEWRKQQITEKTISYIRHFKGHLKCGDQDALNVILYNNWHMMERKFNIMFQDVPRKLAKSKYKQFLQDKVIIHFSVGEHKPWFGLNQNKFRYLYHNYLKKSPYAHSKKYTDFKYTPSYLSSFLQIRVRENFGGYYKIAPIIKKMSGIFLVFFK